MKAINENLKKLSAGPLALFLMVSFTACTHGTSKPTLKKQKNEIWLIDGETLALFRRISDTKEQAIPISKNPDMKKFMCIDTTEADYWLEAGDDRE